MGFALPVLFGRKASLLPENPGEVTLVFKTAQSTDLGDGRTCGAEQLLAFLDPDKA